MTRAAIAHQSTASLLAVLLDAPDLVRQVQALPGPAVVDLVQRVGLEDGSELIALLTTDQLTELLDEVLWDASAPGADETFAPERFLTWLEVMLEAGEDFAADRCAELSEDLLTLAVSRLALVLDLVEVAAAATDQGDGELVEKALDSCQHQELAEYFLVAREPEGWDALVTVLLGLDARHGDLLERILHRAWGVAHEQLDDAGGLYELLTELDVLEIDAAAEREDRRAALGYVAPAAARAFLKLASQRSAVSELAIEDPLTSAYFRELRLPGPSATAGATGRRGAGPVSRVQSRKLLNSGALASPDPSAIGTDWRAVLATQPQSSKSAALGPTPDGASRAGDLREWLVELADLSPSRHARMLDELAYLGNVLVAGETSRGRPWRALEAIERALDVCQRGLERLPGPCSAAQLERWGLVAAFRSGWPESDGDERELVDVPIQRRGSASGGAPPRKVPTGSRRSSRSPR